MAKRLTTEEFKLKLEKENPTVELLSEYNGNKDYITVRCKIDGNVWETKPNWLKRGSRCSVCYHKLNGEMRRNTLEYFISKAREIHGDRYDYSKVEYVNNKTKICIICPEHGEFWQTPEKHINLGHGCTYCFTSFRKTKEQFIEDARKVHGDKYDYSKVEYINNYTKICIICSEHGEFWQTPDSHLSGSGCPKCRHSKLEDETEQFLLNNSINFESQRKFPWMGKQSLDFYLPDYNIAIECQGGQHFYGWNHKYDKDKIIDNDTKKYNKCLEHGIKIIYYFDSSFNENGISIYNNENVINEIKQLENYI